MTSSCCTFVLLIFSSVVYCANGWRRSTLPPVGQHISLYDDTGNDYLPLQKWLSIGISWCVDRDGNRLELQAGQRPSNEACKKLRDCERVLPPSETHGRYVPQCTPLGDFEFSQFWASTGYRWCVDRHGNKLNGTETPPGQPHFSCVVYTKCRQERMEAIRPGIDGNYIPQCDDDDGSFLPLQLWSGTGYSWCVDRDGNEIPGTQTPPGHPLPNCQHWSANQKEARPLSIDRPKRRGTGKLVERCRSKIGICWCEDGRGKKISETITIGHPHPPCDAT